MNPSLMLSSRLQTAQRGAVLIMALMFLTLLTLLGVSAMTNSTSEEKMARATRDYNTAFQAAEAAMRDAENDLTVGSRPIPLSDPSWWSAPAPGTCASAACKVPLAGGTPVWE